MRRFGVQSIYSVYEALVLAHMGLDLEFLYGDCRH